MMSLIRPAGVALNPAFTVRHTRLRSRAVGESVSVARILTAHQQSRRGHQRMLWGMICLLGQI